MNSSCERIFSSLLIFIGFCIGLWYFGNGFLLSKVEIESQNTCSVVPIPSKSASSSTNQHQQQHCLNEFGEIDSQNGCCWLPRKFSRAVILVIDAFRFDFCWSNINKTYYHHQHSQEDHPRFFGKMPVFTEMHTSSESTTWFYEAIADAPTTTMQRLKAITTGGLPTFIDAGRSFASTEVTEDNILISAHGNKKRITLIGDDTWLSLFPNSFTDKSFATPSFDVKDLNGVDNVIEKRLPIELSNYNNWDILIAHTLGVDHVGHRHGPDHPVMTLKLEEMDNLIRDVLKKLPDDTLLVIMGDHGMTKEGNHGGSTFDELSSTLILHYKQKSSPEIRRNVVLKSSKFDEETIVNKQNFRRVMQIDLVPTLSLLLGLPIPYGNVGMILSEPFLPLISGDEDKSTADLLSVVEAAKLNAWQTHKYLEQYSKLATGFGKRSELSQARKILTDIEKEGQLQNQETIIKQYHKAHSLMAKACRAAWATFDLRNMQWGVFTTISFAIALFALLIAAPFNLDELPVKGILYGALAGVVSTIVVPRAGRYATMPAAAAVGAAIGFISTLKHWISVYFKPKRIPWPLFMPIAFVLLHCVGLFSNSFIEADDKVVQFILCSMVIVLGFMLIPSANILTSNVWLDLIGIPFIIRLSALFGANYGRHEAHSDYPLLELLIFTDIPIILLVLSTRRLVWKNTNFMHLPRNCFELSALAALLHWSTSYSNVYIPRISFCLAIASIMFTIIYSIMNKEETKEPKYAGIVANLTVIIALVSGPRSPTAILLMHFQGTMISNVVQKLEGTWSSVLVGTMWGFSAIQFFFATGHTFLFSGIQFESAFVGFEKANMIIGGAFVVLNTIGLPLLASLSLPLLRPTTAMRSTGRWHWLFCASIAFIFVFASACASSTSFVYFARRHLMVWRVFCPKFLFDSALLFTSFFGAFLSWILITSFRLSW